MIEPVTTVLLDRSRDADGLARMCAYSLLAHGALVALLTFVPAGMPQAEDTDRVVMSVSIGPAGPRTGGMTPIPGRAIQEATPESVKARPEPPRPPAERVPEMTAPPAKPVVKPRVKEPPRSAPEDARNRAPSRGPQARAGSAVAETGATGTGFGLSSGGGGTGGYLDVGNFCCPEYLSTMIELIHRNWNSKQGVAADAMVKYTIQRNGQITNVELETSSGYTALDLTAQRALLVTRQLPPLPAAFTEPKLTVHLRFQYQP